MAASLGELLAELRDAYGAVVECDHGTWRIELPNDAGVTIGGTLRDCATADIIAQIRDLPNVAATYHGDDTWTVSWVDATGVAS